MEPASERNRIIESAAEQCDPVAREAFTAFANGVLAGVASHPVGGSSTLETIALEAFEWVSKRAPEEICVRARNPDDRPGHAVVEVLQSDRPFILESLDLAFDRLGLQKRLVLHPILKVVRGEDGRLEQVDADLQNGKALESYAYVELASADGKLPDPAALEKVVREAMGWVRDVAGDHRRMVRAVREVMANLEFAREYLEGGAERVAKIERFLDWIVDGRFVFVGMRRYHVTHRNGDVAVQIVPGTGLGMWRDDSRSRLKEARSGSEIPEEVRDDLEDSRIILMSKSRMESRIHRAGRLDRIVVKEHDEEGRVVGFAIIVGLFTRTVLRTPGSQIPLLSERLRLIVETMGLRYGSHDHKAIVAAFDSAPVELLIGAQPEAIVELLTELVAAAGSKMVRLVLRRHPRGRVLYAAVLMPREHYREDLRTHVRKLLEENAGACYIDDRAAYFDDDTAVIHCFCTAAEGCEIDADEVVLQELLRDLCSPWEDQLLEGLRQQYGEARAPDVAACYEAAFPEALRSRTHPLDAVRDVEALEAFAATGTPQFALYFDHGDKALETATLRMVLPEPPLLSDVTHITDTFGIRVVDAQLAEVVPAGREPVAIESLRILPLGAVQEDLDAISPRLGDALAAAIQGDMPSDKLNGLVLGAGLDWRQVDLIRAYVEYFAQIQGTLSRLFLHKVLLDNPLAVRSLVKYLEASLDPAPANDARTALAEQLRAAFETYRDRIESINEDRALAGLFNLVEATLRTNFFAPPSKPHRIVVKLDSSRVRELSGVVPYREIFVHSTLMTGIHLRGGPVARGGLRWSDRHDDFRVEVLGLMSTQMLKNGIIVPVGAKGGFVTHSPGLTPSKARALADEQYRVFIESLLDVTDNLAPDGAVLPPEGVSRLDGDDPYLVVAADKGTAHLSDTANEIATRRDFWLGDAFASGGSEGYDHKKYAITARGAWECVKHHFDELGIDHEGGSYTVAGIGDMSGDVFGNGMLLARRAKLLAAFDHRDIFLDPNPDPDVAWEERKRLFELPRSSWKDYDTAKISPGGAVHSRTSKRIEVPAALKEKLGLDANEVSGPELVHAILAMKVDLLWNGGIGTYVKASHETQSDAGDRANDSVRIDATELRARVVGEGGNLGLTQAARVEASLRGVRLDSDAIHNSAGVDLSDHEVNYKIALAPLVRSGQLDSEARSKLLFEVADEACEAVLFHNRSQSLALSLDELRSREDPDPFLRATEMLCEFAKLKPAELELPDQATLNDRRAHGAGFTRPELAVLLGLAKQHAQAEIVGGELRFENYLEPLYRSYFPEPFVAAYSEALDGHRLRREITAMRVSNLLIDSGGAALITTLTSELDIEAGAAASAMLQAGDMLRIPDYRRRLLELPATDRSGVYAALVELDDGVRDVAHYIVRSGACDLDADRVERWQTGLDALRGAALEFLSAGELKLFDARRQRLEGQGLPKDLAFDIAGLPLADRGLNILRICAETVMPPIEVGHVYARLGDETGINWFFGRLFQAVGGSLWDRMVLLGLRWDILDLQRAITEYVLAGKPQDPNAAVDEFLAQRVNLVNEIRALERRAAVDDGPSALAVVMRRLRELAPTSDVGRE